MAEEVRYPIRADTAGHERDLREAGGQFNNFAKRAVSAAKKIGAAFSRAWSGIRTGLRRLTVALGVAVGAMAATVRAAMKQETAEMRLANVIKRTGQAAGLSAKEMQEYAASLEMMTGVDDEKIMEAMSILATFTSIKGANFKATTEMLLNMAEVLGQDLPQSAVQLGKALNDPLTGLTALRRVGVSFTEAEKDMVKQLVETNQLAQAQTKILQILSDQGFGGAARAARDTLGGAWRFLKAQFGTLMEAIGAVIADSMGLRDVFEAIGMKFVEWADKIKNSEGVKKFFVDVRKAAEGLLGVFEKIISGDIMGGFKILGELFVAIALDMGSVFVKIVAKAAPAIGAAIAAGFAKAVEAAKDVIYGIPLEKSYVIPRLESEQAPFANTRTGRLLGSLRDSGEGVLPRPEELSRMKELDAFNAAMAESARQIQEQARAAEEEKYGFFGVAAPLEEEKGSPFRRKIGVGELYERATGTGVPGELGSKSNPLWVRPAEPEEFYGGPVST